MRLVGECLLTGLLSVQWHLALASPQQHPLHDTSPALGTATASAPAFRASLLSLHERLVSISSVSGTEDAVGSFLVDHLTANGWAAYLDFVPPAHNTPPHQYRFNVVAWRNPEATGQPPRFPPRHRPRVVLSSHIDVVPPYIPYSIDEGTVTANTTIRGRGSVDAKAAVAAQIVAAEELLASEESGVKETDLMLVFVVSEETAGDGMRHFSSLLASQTDSSLAFDAVIFGEPTTNRLACGHKGFVACTVTAYGKAGHSGYPWLGKSATGLLVEGLAAVLATDLGSSEKWGNSTVNVGTLAGGVAANVIAEKAEALMAIRVAIGPERRPGGRRATAVDEDEEDQRSGADKVVDRLKKVLASVDNEIEVSCNNGYGVVECDCDVDGFETIVVNYGTDVPNLAGNHTRYLYGPGDILVAHSDHEALTVGDLEESVAGYQRLVRHALGLR